MGKEQQVNIEILLLAENMREQLDKSLKEARCKQNFDKNLKSQSFIHIISRISLITVNQITNNSDNNNYSLSNNSESL